jgi:hypothetical protein
VPDQSLASAPGRFSALIRFTLLGCKCLHVWTRCHWFAFNAQPVEWFPTNNF